MVSQGTVQAVAIVRNWHQLLQTCGCLQLLNGSNFLSPVFEAAYSQPGSDGLLWSGMLRHCSSCAATTKNTGWCCSGLAV